MITGGGARPPLHRRFDEETARAHVRNRYRSMRGQISDQVAILQQNDAFRQMCRAYYDGGYPDWLFYRRFSTSLLTESTGTEQRRWDFN